MRRAIVSVLLAALAATIAGSALVLARWSAPRGASTDLEQLGRYGQVPTFRLVERSGHWVTSEDLRGSIWVADFIYTECTESCPTQSLQFAALQREFVAEPRFRLVSITVDPGHDTPEVLRRYAERYGATDRWWLLTGDKREIYCLARDVFRLGVADSRTSEPLDCGTVSWLGPTRAWASHGSGGFVMHSARLALVDATGQIRAYHLATDADSMARLRLNSRRLLADAGRRET